jgi:hypothetical protein
VILAGCKHIVAFLYWLVRRSEEPSPTETRCYWRKSTLPDVVNSDAYSAASGAGKKRLLKSDNVEGAIDKQSLHEANDKKVVASIVQLTTPADNNLDLFLLAGPDQGLRGPWAVCFLGPPGQA